MTVHQLLVGAAPGDAITNCARWLHQSIAAADPSATINARHIHPDLAHVVDPLDAIDRASADDWVLWHASIGDDLVAEVLARTSARIALLHHNVTPGRFVADLDPTFAAELDHGRTLLDELEPRVERAWADSAFNAIDLVALGYPDVEVARVVGDPTWWDAVDSRPSATHHLDTVVDGPFVLSVGQLLPHKRPELVIESFHVLSTYLVPEAHLALTGSARFPEFAAGLQRLVVELVLDRAWLAGHVPDDELVAMWRRADVFVTCSEHEGFCVPVVEAMHHGVPVVARDCGALGETIGDAGLVLDADAGPELVAEALAAVLGDADLHAELVARGHRRAEVLAAEARAARNRIVDALTGASR